MNSTEQNVRFNVLDAFRGLFAYAVVFYHMSPYSVLSNNQFFKNGDLFVDFFFVLSGFVIYHSYQNKIGSRNEALVFLKKRFFRLYPLFLFTLSIYFMFEMAKRLLYLNGFAFNSAPSEHNNFLSLLSHILLLNSVKLPFVQDLSWNYPSWSISAEFVSYFLFALVFSFAFLAKISRVVLLLVLALTAYGILCFFTQSLLLTYTYNYGFVRGIVGFSFGVCLYALREKQSSAVTSPVLANILEVISVIVVFFLITNGKALRIHGLLFPIIFSAVIFIFSFEKGIVSRFLATNTFFNNIGRYSYSIYLNHAIVLIVVDIVFVRLAHLPTQMHFVMPFIIAVALYYYSKFTYNNIELRFYNSSPVKSVK